MIYLEDVLTTSWRRPQDVFARGLEDLKGLVARSLEDILKLSWRRLEDVLKVYDQDEYIRLDQDVFWRHMTQVTIFVLTKMTSEEEDVRRPQETSVFWNTAFITSEK